MAFPLDIRTELKLDGVWTDITDEVYQRDPITITRGRPDETANPDPSKATLTLNNRAGKYSPRNPTGALYGKIRRNTPIRVRLLPAPGGYLLFNHSEDTASAPDTAALSIAGDVDIRLDAALDDWRTADTIMLAGKYTSAGDQRSWAWFLDPDGTVGFRWSPLGTFASNITKFSTVAMPEPANKTRKALRVTLDVDNGASGNDLKFWTADTIAGPWTQLGATVTTAGVTSIFDSTAAVTFGDVIDIAGEGITGRGHHFQLRNGIDGTVVASPDFTVREGGVETFLDAQGNQWSVTGFASLVDPAVRFAGEVAEWPQRWDPAGKDVHTPVVAAGPLRRLGQGASALDSTMYRGVLALATPAVAYWPAEDEEGATSLASALAGGKAIRMDGGPSVLSTYDGFESSKPLPTLSLARWHGSVSTALTGAMQIRFLMKVQTAVATDTRLLLVTASGSAPRYNVWLNAAGSLKIVAQDPEGVNLVDTGYTSFDVNGKERYVSLEVFESGADVKMNLSLVEPGQTTGGSIGVTTVTGRTLGSPRIVGVNPDYALNDTVIGHISVQTEITNLFELGAQTSGYLGETAGRRVARLCDEEGVPVRVVGDPDDTAKMGPQLPKTLVQLLTECAESDTGILHEPRDFVGLAFRTAASMYSQAAALTLDYAAAHIAAIEPVEDDEHIRNDVTVQREGGSTARALDQTGPLGVDAIGRLDTTITLSLQGDHLLADQASRRLRLGTVDQARYPIIGVDMAAPALVASQALTDAVVALNVGDRVVVDNPPAWLPPDDIEQLAQGFTETLLTKGHRVDVNCTPEEPWHIGVYDETAGTTSTRYSSDGSTVALAVNSTSTSLSVATIKGPLWSVNDGPFDVHVGGERMTVTAVTGAASPQTFTVTRSVNGVVKSHALFAEVRLFRPAYYGM